MMGSLLYHPKYTPYRHRRCISTTFGVILVLWSFSKYYNNPIVIESVYGWGQKGHEIVGNVASALLSQRALQNIEQLLNISNTNHTNSRTPPTFLRNHECVEYCTPLAIVADWADQVRFYKKWSSPLHYIDVRDDIIVPNGCPVVGNSWDATSPNAMDHSKKHYTKCSFDYTRDCPNDICVAGAIMNYTKQLRHGYALAGTGHVAELKESLMFLVHFMGDIHQPLHCSRTTDRGGNNIHVHYHVKQITTVSHHVEPKHLRQISRSTDLSFARGARSPNQQHPQRNTLRLSLSAESSSHHSSQNLHAVWDDSIIETILERDFQDSRNAFEVSLLLYIHDIRTNHPSIYHNIWLRCSDATNIHCVSIWGEESFDLAMLQAYANVDGSEIVDDTTLDEEYYLTRNPIVRTRLAIAAVRLAVNLEQIFT